MTLQILSDRPREAHPFVGDPTAHAFHAVLNAMSDFEQAIGASPDLHHVRQMLERLHALFTIVADAEMHALARLEALNGKD